MKKLILLMTILFVSVVSTACINNLAVQELNNKAKEYMANGETEKAIARLRSSIDLDTSIFETHYNLGVALISANQNEEAQHSLENAIKLNPEFADSYYSLALSFEYQADDLIKGKAEEDEVDKILKEEATESNATIVNKTDKNELSENDKLQIVKFYNKAIENYNTYLVKKANAQDKDSVTAKIEYLNEQINKYNPDVNVKFDGLGKK